MTATNPQVVIEVVTGNPVMAARQRAFIQRALATPLPTPSDKPTPKAG